MSLVGQYFESISTETTIKYVNREKFENLYILSPRNAEQQIIVNYLNNKACMIKTVKNKIQTQIEKLKEAKQSLISEAVTGKMDLRDWEVIEEGGA